jgi:hypothetical protein
VDCPDDGVSYFGAWLGSAEQRKAQDEENLVIGDLVEPLLKAFSLSHSNHQFLNPKT